MSLKLLLLLSILLPLTLILLILILILLFTFLRRTTQSINAIPYDEEKNKNKKKNQTNNPQTVLTSSEQEEELRVFLNGEDLTIVDILEAPGEVIGKSTYGTVYKAALERHQTVNLLRFIRPAACSSEMDEIRVVIGGLGLIRHENLVPLLAFYAGSRGEKLLVHPFYRIGSLSQFIRGCLIIVS